MTEPTPAQRGDDEPKPPSEASISLEGHDLRPSLSSNKRPSQLGEVLSGGI